MMTRKRKLKIASNDTFKSCSIYRCFVWLGANSWHTALQTFVLKSDLFQKDIAHSIFNKDFSYLLQLLNGYVIML